MFYNYLKIAIRNLLRYKVFSFINILGLALGMSCSILIMLWVQDELSYDRFHAHSDRLYRIIEEQHYPGADNLIMDATPGPLAEALPQAFPEIVHAAKASRNQQVLLARGEKRFKENGLYVSPDFLKMFSFPLLKGDSATALSQPHTIVIDEDLALKYFGTTEVLGRMLKVNNQATYKITGVLARVPQHSTLWFRFLMPAHDYESQPGMGWLKQWGNNGIRTFVLLRPDADVAGFNARIEDFVRRHYAGSNTDLFLQPFPDGYLYGYFKPGRVPDGRIQYVRLFSVVAFFVLLIACINFMNLSTARSSKRAREVGVRKVIGAVQSVLVGQFIGESILVALLAIVVATGLTQLSLDTFNELTGKQVQLDFADPLLLASLAGMALVTGLVAGSYPALILSAFKPVAVLKGAFVSSSKAALFRKGLVVFQFVLSGVMIICTLVVYQQMHYIRHKDIGLNRENVGYVHLEGELGRHAAQFKQELSQAPGIAAVGAASQNPIMVSHNGGAVEWQGKDPKADILFGFIRVDYGFAETMQIKLREGRFFSKAYRTDSMKVLLNEEAVRLMGLRQPLGEKIKLEGASMEVIGVVKDFHFAPLHMPMQPLIMMLNPADSYFAFFRMPVGQTATALASLKQLQKKYNPAYPLEYHFLNEDFERSYRSEVIIIHLAYYFAAIAIIISCMGLFGLALFTAEQRTREIGIRKVLGASVSGIVVMLSKDFLKLVLLANLIAWPLGWYLMQVWLQGYAYRVEVGWWIFALAGAATFFIALVTVSFLAVRAAIASPVRSLRSE